MKHRNRAGCLHPLEGKNDMVVSTARQPVPNGRAGESLRATPVVGAASGAALIGFGLKRKGALGGLAAVVGGGLLFRAFKAKKGSAAAQNGRPYGQGVMVKESVLVNKPAAQLYALWRDFENLPAFMPHVESVRALDDTNSHWKVRGPMGASVQWNAEVIADRKDELIGWRTLAGQRVAHAGSVRFEPLDAEPQRTKVAATLQYNPPAGETGDAVARLLGANPRKQVRNDLGRFKEFAESMDLSVLERLLPARRRAQTQEE